MWRTIGSGAVRRSLSGLATRPGESRRAGARRPSSPWAHTSARSFTTLSRRSADFRRPARVRSPSEGWSSAGPEGVALLVGGGTLFHVKLDPEGVLAGLDVDQVAKLRSFAATLSGHGADLGLVSRADRDRVWGRHVLDSLRVLSCLLPQDRTLADLGSGGGLPGIPLAVARPSIPVTLIESRSRRVGFLESVIQDLAIGNARVIHARSEDVPERFGACTARA